MSSHSIPIPEGYQQVMPYLIIRNAAEFLTFMKKVFKAEEVATYMRDEKLIMHGELKIGNSVIMFADSTSQIAPQNAGLYVIVENADETYKAALAQGAVSVMEPSDKEYGRSSGVTDPFGNTWWITSAL
jgi:PhnB protein